jgi:methionyl-tRNA formyltransferase
LHSPDIILLDGSVIIKPQIFSVARVGAINSHPGLLPEYRGVDSVRWAIYHGKPVGATAHFVDSGLDTGPILVKEKVDLQKGEDILRLRVRVMRVCAKIAVQATWGLSEKKIIPQAQPKEGGYYSWAPLEVREKVDEILRGL